MLKKEINFSDLADFFKKHQVPTFDEEIDEYGGYFITAARIAAVIIAPDPLTKISVFCAGIDAASLRFSKLLSWLPDKFKYKDREKLAIHRYELASYVNFILLQIAIKNGVKNIVMPHITTILKAIELDEDDRIELQNKCKESDKGRETMSFPTNCSISKEDISSQSIKIIDPILSILNKNIDKCKETNPSLKKIDTSKMKEHFVENITLQYQAFLINFSGEFHEFALWADITLKVKIIKELKDASKITDSQNKKLHQLFIKQTEKIIGQIGQLRDKSFIKDSGFPSFMDSYKTMFKIQEEHLSRVLTGKTIENINAHHNQIKSELDKPLSDNTDIEEIIYPLNKDIYISQSFESITYKKKEHRKGFLTADSLGENAENGENIGNYLLQTLVDPNYATKPIILLGNPGAGKSMLSKMFAGLLCETTDFIPFLIKLRSVASSSASISEHINKGLANSIENSSDVNWLDWAKEFKNRIPVIIMDGFDELMQTSNRELNGYVDSIREFQEKAINSSVCVRIILTSRISVMQDVSIPEGTKIIKLDSFDGKRRDLWIRRWNDAQKKPKYKFAIPKNDKIELLAKEPLLMFMLAVYDFDNSELQNMANDKNFNQSKLYDSLLERFIKRQLEKNPAFRDASKNQKDKEEELFRLRLGMIALMMFMNDTTSRDTQKLSEEMTAFGIHKSSMQTENVLGGFFFIHENKSTTESEAEKFNYEFLHKTFGEFLTADFMLRVAKKQYERMIDSNQEIIARKETFSFCFGYNWLHKHNNIQNFLFEHAKQIIKVESPEYKFTVNLIKTDLNELFDKGHQAFPVTNIRLLEKKSVIEHLGVYSQNLIFLWLAIADDNQQIEFAIFDTTEDMGKVINEPKYESQDRDEINRNKLHWKRLAKLWTLVGNYSATAKLTEWISVVEQDNSISLSRHKSEVIHNFSDAANVACNDFELLLSYFDNEYKFSPEQHTLGIIDEIIKKKTELASLAIDVVLHRFHDLFSIESADLFGWFASKELNKKQKVIFMKKVALVKWQIEPTRLVEFMRFILEDKTFLYPDNPQAMIEYFRLLVDLKGYFPVSHIFNPDVLDEILHQLSKDFRYSDNGNPQSTLEYIRLLNELNKVYPFRRKFKIDLIEESLHRLSKDMRHIVAQNPYFAFEYLKLINELRKYYPIDKKMHQEFFEESLMVISAEIKNIARNNPHAVLEYLKLLYDLKKYFPYKRKFPEELFLESITYLAEEWKFNFQDNHYNLLEYLKVTMEFGKEYSIEQIIPRQLLLESIERISSDFVYLVRENPRTAQEYIKVLNQFYKLFPDNEFRSHKVLDEINHRMSKEMDFGIRGNLHSTLLYLEFSLLHSKALGFYHEGHFIERMIEAIQKRTHSSAIILKAAVLLIKYSAPQPIIQILLQNHPKIKNIYVTSPTIAIEIMEAIAENEYNNEKFN